jgi:hypothetical protein
MLEKCIDTWSSDNSSDWSKLEATGEQGNRVHGKHGIWDTDNAECYYVASLRMVAGDSSHRTLQSTSCHADASQLQALPILVPPIGIKPLNSCAYIGRILYLQYFDSKLLVGFKVNDGRKFPVLVFGQKGHRESGQATRPAGWVFPQP